MPGSRLKQQLALMPRISTFRLYGPPHFSAIKDLFGKACKLSFIINSFLVWNLQSRVYIMNPSLSTQEFSGVKQDTESLPS